MTNREQVMYMLGFISGAGTTIFVVEFVRFLYHKVRGRR